MSSDMNSVLMIIIFFLGAMTVFALKKIEELEERLKALGDCHENAEEHVLTLLHENEQLKARIERMES